MHKVPKKGAAVFAPEPGVSAQWVAGITSLSGEEVWLKVRWPAICRGNAKPVRESVILMSEKPVVKLDPAYVDAYHLDEMMAERAAKQANPQHSEVA